MLKMKNC